MHSIDLGMNSQQSHVSKTGTDYCNHSQKVFCIYFLDTSQFFWCLFFTDLKIKFHAFMWPLILFKFHANKKPNSAHNVKKA